MSEFTVIIPARIGSQRLPKKALLEIAGKPMLQRVYEKATQSKASQVVVATDNNEIMGLADNIGAKALMTDPDHRSGSDRLAEAVDLLQLDDDHPVVNLQGDEPLMVPALIDQIAEDLIGHPDAQITSLYTPINDEQMLDDPNVVKFVMDHHNYALYFSRLPIPYHRDAAMIERLNQENATFCKRLGMYAYSAGFIRTFVTLPHCPLEEAEKLEQLRMLYYGYRLHMSEAKQMPLYGSVDTPEDMAKVVEIIEQHPELD